MKEEKAYRHIIDSACRIVLDDMADASPAVDPCYAQRLAKATTAALLANAQSQLAAAQAAYQAACAALDACEGKG